LATETEPKATDPATLAQEVGLPAAVVPRLYIDPQHRFACVVPDGWTKEALPGGDQSRLRLRSGPNEIMVTSHGADWPELTEQDKAAVSREVSQRLAAMYFDGLYANVLETNWRLAEGKLALLFEIEVTYPDYVLLVSDVEYRCNGRANSVEMRIRQRELRPELLTKFEDFIANFRSLPAEDSFAGAPLGSQ
jgi:hypothetical protein